MAPWIKAPDIVTSTPKTPKTHMAEGKDHFLQIIPWPLRGATAY